MYRGSRKHVIDWTEQPTFLTELLRLVRPVEVKIVSDSRWMPLGYPYPDEARLDTAALWRCQSRRGGVNCHAGGCGILAAANTPNWYLALSCEIEGRSGLVLIEAKAHDTELPDAAK